MKYTLPIEAIDIKKILPHRYPLLLIDRIIEIELLNKIKAIKNVSNNEQFFNGHFPAHPVMPGVLIIESLAQAAGALSILSIGDSRKEDEIYFLVGVDDTRFKRQIIPGDQLTLEVSFLSKKQNIAKFSAVAKVGEEIACTAVLMCARKADK